MNTTGIVELNGSYKLSNKILDRILSRAIICKDGSISDSISNNEILTLLHFSQICDITGYIEEYKIPELEKVIGCSRRAAYNIIKNLENKGFITQGKSSWTGFRSIKIVDNDFFNADYKEKKYLNTNFSYFNHNHEDYQAFKKLSLFAKKTLLVILTKYQPTYGYRVNINSLKIYIGVSKKVKLLGYLKELSDMFDPRLFNVSSNQVAREKYYNLYIHSKMPCFIPEQGISIDKDSYFKHNLSIEFRHHNIIFEKFGTTVEKDITRAMLQQLYSLSVHYLKLGVSYETVRAIILKQAVLFGKIDDLTIFYINNSLQISLQKSG